MRSESKKSFKHGFELTEQELRRIFDILTQQISRNTQSSAPKSSFEIKFRNGVIAEPSSLDEILALENIGSGSIIRLQIKIDDGQVIPTSVIKLEFINADDDSDSEGKSIGYTITGDDRDWVFVTSSQLEERITKIKQTTIGRYLRSKELLFLLPLIIMMLLLFFMFLSIVEQSKNLEREINIIEANWKNGTLIDPIDVILALERQKANKVNISLFLFPSNSSIVFFPAIISGVLFVLLFVVRFGWPY